MYCITKKIKPQMGSTSSNVLAILVLTTLHSRCFLWLLFHEFVLSISETEMKTQISTHYCTFKSFFTWTQCLLVFVHAYYNPSLDQSLCPSLDQPVHLWFGLVGSHLESCLITTVESRNNGPKSSGIPHNSGFWFSPLTLFSFSLYIGNNRFWQ